VTGGCTSFGTADRAAPRCLARQGEAPRSGQQRRCFLEQCSSRRESVERRERRHGLELCGGVSSHGSPRFFGGGKHLDLLERRIPSRGCAGRRSSAGARGIESLHSRCGELPVTRVLERSSEEGRRLRAVAPLLGPLDPRRHVLRGSLSSCLPVFRDWLPRGQHARMSTRAGVRADRFGYASARRYGCRSRPTSSRSREARVKPPSKGAATGGWPGT
jgi:hypothetical protein